MIDLPTHILRLPEGNPATYQAEDSKFMANFESFKVNFMEQAVELLREKLEKLKAARPKLPLRDAANELNSSEAELLSFQLGEGVTLLKPEFTNLLKKLSSFGKVRLISRNEDCIMESQSPLPTVQDAEGGLLSLKGENFDYVFSIEDWKCVYALKSEEENSVELYDKYGDSTLKIELLPDTDSKKFDEFIKTFKAEVQEFEKPIPKEVIHSSGDIDWEALGEAWKELTDVSDFEKVLYTFGASRIEALRHAPNNNFARKIKNKKAVHALEEAAKSDIELEIIVPAEKHIHSHTGGIKDLMWHGSWINVIEENFGFHFNTWNLGEVWIVRIPTDYGMISSLEAYNKKGNLMVRFLSKRKDGKTEIEKWRKLMFYFEED